MVPLCGQDSKISSERFGCIKTSNELTASWNSRLRECFAASGHDIPVSSLHMSSDHKRTVSLVCSVVSTISTQGDTRSSKLAEVWKPKLAA